MADVYAATDEVLAREVAVKILADRYADDDALRVRFSREAVAAARLSGKPHIVTIYDVGEWDGQPFIVMERAGGGSVAERMRDGKVSVPVALRWLEEAAVALDAAHASRVVHRDIKPGNLLLAADDRVRVADFGIASAAGLTALTETGTVLGTAGYLAPEQAAGIRAGPEADRYALAVVAYELLAGQRPFQTGSAGAAELFSAAQQPIPQISHARPGLPEGLDIVFECALAKDPAGRYESCCAFVRDLRSIFAQEAEATRITPAVPGDRERAPWPWLLALILLLLAAAGVGTALLVARGSDGDRRREVVRTVTAEGVTVTVAAPVPTTAGTSATGTGRGAATSTAPIGPSGSELNLAGYRRMLAGDYGGALPLLERSVDKLAGSDSLDEAYALYNLAFSRFALGRCDGLGEMLDRSEQIQGHRTQIDELRRQVVKRCR